MYEHKTRGILGNWTFQYKKPVNTIRKVIAKFVAISLEGIVYVVLANGAFLVIKTIVGVFK